MKAYDALLRLTRDKKGSATITVIVTMLMVIALGSALLFAAYTSYRVALAQRDERQNLYSAERAMDDIRTGLQNEVSKALSAAYTKTLTEYAKSGEAQADAQERFAESFKNELLAARLVTANESTAIISENAGRAEYYTQALMSFVNAPVGASVSLANSSREASINRAAAGNIIGEGVIESITLKQVSLRYIEDGYQTDLTSDIIISVPAFQGELGEYAVVAEKGIDVDGGASALSGSVYSGADITVKNGSLELSGTAYVADDLVLSGSGASATLIGQYYGFGSSTTNANESSAILVNGKNSILSLSGLDRLALAGVSFINVVDASDTLPGVTEGILTGGKPVPMGQSLSFKANQLAYLIPVECLTNYASNPCELRQITIVENGETQTVYAEPEIKTDLVIWGGGSGAKTLDDYIGGGKGSVKIFYKNLGGGNIKIAYVFLAFNDLNAANTYFKDYFEQYPDRIEQYLDFYLSLDGAVGSSVNAAGNVFTVETVDGKEQLKLIPASSEVDAQTRRFSDFVNVGALDALPLGTTLKFRMGGSYAVVTNTSYTITGDESIIITSGDLTLGKALSGSLLCGGKLTLNGGSVSSTPMPAGLLSASDEGGREYKLSDFLKSGYGTQELLEGGNNWAGSNLVGYANWTKN